MSIDLRRIFLITVFYFIGTNFVISQNNYKQLCEDVLITTKLKNWRTIKGVKKYVESGKWDEYDENGSLNPIPNNLDVILDLNLKSYYLKHSFEIGDLKVEDFIVSTEVKLIMGESSDCYNIVNPTTINAGTLLDSKRINYFDFFMQKNYKSIRLKIPFKIKDVLNTIKDDELMLEKIIIIIKLKTLDGEEKCIIEFCKTIC